MLHFKTPSREVLLNDVSRLDADGKTALLNGWSCLERGTARLRTGTAGTMITKKKFPMNLLRLLKTGTWKIPCTLLLAGALALACLQCSVRSLVYLPPQPRDKTAYLEKRAAWEPHRRTFHHNGAKLSGWLIEKKGQPSWYITGKRHGHLHDASLPGPVSPC